MFRILFKYTELLNASPALPGKPATGVTEGAIDAPDVGVAKLNAPLGVPEDSPGWGKHHYELMTLCYDHISLFSVTVFKIQITTKG